MAQARFSTFQYTASCAASNKRKGGESSPFSLQSACQFSSQRQRGGSPLHQQISSNSTVLTASTA